MTPQPTGEATLSFVLALFAFIAASQGAFIAAGIAIGGCIVGCALVVSQRLVIR